DKREQGVALGTVATDPGFAAVTIHGGISADSGSQRQGRAGRYGAISVHRKGAISINRRDGSVRWHTRAGNRLSRDDADRGDHWDGLAGAGRSRSHDRGNSANRTILTGRRSV